MAARNLHELPKFQDRWSHLYLDKGQLDRQSGSLVFDDGTGKMPIPIDQLCLVMLGPGTSVTHAAFKALAENNCLICWTGQEGSRLYAHGTGGTHSSHRLLTQVCLYANEKERRKVARRMYQKRFPEIIPENTSIEKLRGKEGYRVRTAYEENSEKYGVKWDGRNYQQENWDWADPINRALSAASACLYGLCHAAILSAGYSPAIGFIHTGKMLSFVYDIADLYRTELILPVAFETAALITADIERMVRTNCREKFREVKLISRIIPDIAEVLDARDDLTELPGEFEGRAVSMADRTDQRGISGKSVG